MTAPSAMLTKLPLLMRTASSTPWRSSCTMASRDGMKYQGDVARVWGKVWG